MDIIVVEITILQTQQDDLTSDLPVEMEGQSLGTVSKTIPYKEKQREDFTVTVQHN